MVPALLPCIDGPDFDSLPRRIPGPGRVELHGLRFRSGRWQLLHRQDAPGSIGCVVVPDSLFLARRTRHPGLLSVSSLGEAGRRIGTTRPARHSLPRGAPGAHPVSGLRDLSVLVALSSGDDLAPLGDCLGGSRRRAGMVAGPQREQPAAGESATRLLLAGELRFPGRLWSAAPPLGESSTALFADGLLDPPRRSPPRSDLRRCPAGTGPGPAAGGCLGLRCDRGASPNTSWPQDRRTHHGSRRPMVSSGSPGHCGFLTAGSLLRVWVPFRPCPPTMGGAEYPAVPSSHPLSARLRLGARSGLPGSARPRSYGGRPRVVPGELVVRPLCPGLRAAHGPATTDRGGMGGTLRPRGAGAADDSVGGSAPWPGTTLGRPPYE